MDLVLHHLVAFDVAHFCSDTESDSFVDLSGFDPGIMKDQPEKVPTVDPSVLANAKPWVKLIFDHFDNVDRALVDYKEEVKTLPEKQKKTDEEVQSLQDDVDGLRNYFKELREKVDGKVDKLESEFNAHKAEVEKILNERLEKFEARANAVLSQVPSLSVAQQCSVEDKFGALLKEAVARKNIFVIGKVPDAPPTVLLATAMKRHFEQYGAKLLPAVGKATIRRFSIPDDKVGQAKETLMHYNLAIRDLGYWVVQDSPPALRRMYSNVYAFYKFRRDLLPFLRRF